MLQLTNRMDAKEYTKLNLESEIVSFSLRVANHLYTPSMPLFRAIQAFEKEFPEEFELVEKLKSFMASYDQVDETISNCTIFLSSELTLGIHRRIMSDLEFTIHNTLEHKGVRNLPMSDLESLQNAVSIIKNSYRLLAELWRDHRSKVAVIWRWVEDLRLVEKEIKELIDQKADGCAEPVRWEETKCAWEIYKELWEGYDDGMDFASVIKELHDYAVDHSHCAVEYEDDFTDYTASMLLRAIAACVLEMREGKTYFNPPTTVLAIRDRRM